MSDQNLSVVVHAVRSSFETGKIPEALLLSLYQSYAQIPNLGEFIRQSAKLFPKLNCGIASVYLQHLLGRGKVIQGKYAGECHTFLYLEDQTVVDITADQYGGPAVYMGKLQTPWSF
ncbi:MAG: hypothetical protein ABI758_01945 [Candidatus Woesebacteria bacterium]